MASPLERRLQPVSLLPGARCDASRAALERARAKGTSHKRNATRTRNKAAFRQPRRADRGLRPYGTSVPQVRTVGTVVTVSFTASSPSWLTGVGFPPRSIDQQYQPWISRQYGVLRGAELSDRKLICVIILVDLAKSSSRRIGPHY